MPEVLSDLRYRNISVTSQIVLKAQCAGPFRIVLHNCTKLQETA